MSACPFKTDTSAILLRGTGVRRDSGCALHIQTSHVLTLHQVEVYGSRSHKMGSIKEREAAHKTLFCIETTRPSSSRF